MARVLFDDRSVRELSYYIVKQAIDDWRYLCRGGEESKWCNFSELTRFFKKECSLFLENPDFAERIYAQMLRERYPKKKAGVNRHEI